MNDDHLYRRVTEAAERATDYLWQPQRPDGAWTDRLSQSAVPTSMALIVLSRAGRERYRREIEEGLDWLRRTPARGRRLEPVG